MNSFDSLLLQLFCVRIVHYCNLKKKVESRTGDLAGTNQGPYTKILGNYIIYVTHTIVYSYIFVYVIFQEYGLRHVITDNET